MTDKLKALMAKWRGIGALRSKDCFCGNCMSAKSFGVCADELEEVLAEQAPAGEFDARDHEPRLFSPLDITLKDGEAIVAFLGCSCGWNSDGKGAEKELWSEHILRAAGRSSQPVEPRDPAGK